MTCKHPELFNQSISHRGMVFNFMTRLPKPVKTPQGCIEPSIGRNAYIYRRMMDYFGYDIEGMAIHHKCFNPKCINPEHLQVMTHEAHAKLHHALRGPGRPPRRFDNRGIRKTLQGASYGQTVGSIAQFTSESSEVSIPVLVDILTNLDFITSKLISEYYRESIGNRRCQKIAKEAISVAKRLDASMGRPLDAFKFLNGGAAIA